MDRDADSIDLLDMTACEPRDSFSPEFEPGKWTTVPYEVERGRGVMLFSGPESGAPALTLPPGVDGWHHIYVATYRSDLYPETCILLKLTDDPGYARAAAETFRPSKDLVPPDMLPGRTDLCEAFWKTADLTGQDIIIDRPRGGEMAETLANIAYVRLVPCSDAERDGAARDIDRTDTRRLIANYDGGQHHMWGIATEQDIIDEFQAIDGSDFDTVLWGCAMGLNTMYPSRRVETRMDWPYGLPGRSRLGRLASDRQEQHGYDPLRGAVRRAQEIGVRILPQLRMTGSQLPPEHFRCDAPDGFQRRHPELRCRTREGHSTRHLSHAYPEVRERYVDLFREWIEDYQADGVSIIFCRSHPYALYDPPVLDAFRADHGMDMRDVDPFDERVLRHRAHFLTETLRATRHMLDEAGISRGVRLETCYVVAGDAYTPEGCPNLGPFTTPRSLGIDIETWVREGLVDQLVVHLEGSGDPEGLQTADTLRDRVSLADGTPTRVYADVYPRRQSANSMRVRAMAHYDAGVDGLCFWDCQGRATRLSGWAMHRLLGHRDELAEMKSFADSLFRLVPMTELDGYRLDHEYALPTDG